MEKLLRLCCCINCNILLNHNTVISVKRYKAGVHRSKCTPAEILSLPIISAFFLVLLLLCLLLLFLTQTFTNGACFRFLIEQICHITLAVVHHYRGNLADFLHAILLAPFIYIMIPLGEK